MKHLLLGTAAIALGVVAISAPAKADGLKLGIEGHFKGYMSWLDQDSTPDDVDTAAPDNEARSERSVDILRESEVHFTGETTLDNGLAVGVHIEADIDQAAAANDFETEEAYAFFSGHWGRVNFGAEDGAGYLLQVAAPSADSNIDGIRQYVQPVNYTIMDFFDNNVGAAGAIEDVSLADIYGGLAAGLLHDVDDSETPTADDVYVGAGFANVGIAGAALFRFDYDMAVSGTDNKFTYLTPVFNGFQLGASYTPELGNGTRDFLLGNNDDDSIDEFGDVWEIAARYEGQFDQIGFAIGGGYVHAEREADELAGDADVDQEPVFFIDENGNGAYNLNVDTVLGTLDDRQAWNLGLDLDWSAFGLGVAYMEDDLGVSSNMDRETWTIGLDYTTGPFKLGANYYTQDQELGSLEIETDRYTGGVVYTYGPGMTFRGSISFIDHEGLPADNNQNDATSVLLGTQINF